MATVGDLLARPIYGMAQVDRLLDLPSGTARRWIDGYDRAGTHYDPVVRITTTGENLVTWGEFIETRLLSELRSKSVPMLRLRPTIERLRQQLQTPYPLASADLWLEDGGRELLLQAQEDTDLQRPLQMVIVRSGQHIMWTPRCQRFQSALQWSRAREITSMTPRSDFPEVRIDPVRGFGEPTVNNIRTEIIAELFESGEGVEQLADVYELSVHQVESAIRFERSRFAAAA